MLFAIASVSTVVLPLVGAALWLGLQPADRSEHPFTGEYLATSHAEDELSDSTPVVTPRTTLPR